MAQWRHTWQTLNPCPFPRKGRPSLPDMKAGTMPSPLDDLLQRAEHYAGFAMRQMGRVPPAMMAYSPGGLRRSMVSVESGRLNTS